MTTRLQILNVHFLQSLENETFVILPNFREKRNFAKTWILFKP